MMEILYNNQHPDVNSSGHNNYGFLHFTGILLNLKNEIEDLLSLLNDNVDQCIEAIKSLDGQFALVWKTESFCLTVTDFSLMQFLYMSDSHITTAPITNTAPLPSNSIQVYDNDLNLKRSINFFENYSSGATKEDFNLLSESVLQTVTQLRKKGSLTLLLSEGIDSGFLHCVCLKNGVTVDVINYQCYPIYEPDFALVKKRKRIHTRYDKSEFKIIIDNKTHYDGGEFAPHVDTCIKNIFSENIVLAGFSADRMFTDNGHEGQELGTDNSSRWGGIFPLDLHNYENYWVNEDNIKLMTNFQTVFGNKKIFDVFCTKNTVIEWYKITSLIKNTQRYKQWMIEYSEQIKGYPNLVDRKNGIRISS